MVVRKEVFFKIQSKFTDIPFNQTEEWLISNYSTCLDKVLFFVDNLNKPSICCWGVVFQRKFIGKHLIIDGESLKNDTTSKKIKMFYDDIVDIGFSIINISNVSFYNPDYEVGIRRSDFTRPLGLSLSPLTLLLDLQKDFKFHRNWRRNVKKAIVDKVVFKYIEDPSVNEINGFIMLFNELNLRKKLGYNLSFGQLKILLGSPRYKLFLVYNNKDILIAGRIVYLNKEKSYDLYAANSNEALSNGAVYYLQEEMLKFLKINGTKIFDYGRIPPGKGKMDAIYISKSYSNGIPEAYNGQWEYSKYKFLRLLICIKKFYLSNMKLY